MMIMAKIQEAELIESKPMSEYTIESSPQVLLINKDSATSDVKLE